MSDQAQAPAEQTQEPTTEVKNPEAVLKQNAELLAELKTFKAKAKEYEGFDFEKAKAAIAAQEQAEQEKLTKRGEWEKLKEQLDQRHATQLQEATARHEQLLSNLHREKLTNLLTEQGVLPDRVKYLVHELQPQTELDSSEEGFFLKKKGGIGDATEMDAWIGNVKQTSPFFFASTSASGSGAQPSNGTSGGKTMAEAAFDALTPPAQAAFLKDGGNVV